MSPKPLTIDATPAECAAALFDATMSGGPDYCDDDPILHALYWHCRQYMHGVCTLLAMHLNATRNLPIILLEGRQTGDDKWMLRHAAVTVTPDPVDLADFDNGYDVQILDAAGGGTFGDRAELYGVADWEYRVVYAANSDNQFSRKMDAPRGEPVNIEDHVLAMPGLCRALDLEFDLRTALVWILDNAEPDGRLDPEIRAAVGDILEFAATVPA